MHGSDRSMFLGAGDDAGAPEPSAARPQAAVPPPTAVPPIGLPGETLLLLLLIVCIAGIGLMLLGLIRASLGS